MMTQNFKNESGLSRPSRLWRHESGNIAIITALLMLPVLFAMGMAFDLTLAQSRADQIHGMADAAALSAVTPSEMTVTASTAQSHAQTLFVGELNKVSGVSYSASNISATATDTETGTVVNRSATVAWSGSSTNVFGTLLGMATFPISGSSTAASSTAPNINFYLLLDSSPSMYLAATPTGIAQLAAATWTSNNASKNYTGAPSPNGCAFACHESNPAGDNLGNPGGEDNYALARNLGITLRSDLVNTASQDLMSTAYSTEKGNNATYQIAIYTIDVSVNQLTPLTSCLLPSPTQTCAGPAQTAAANYAPLEVYTNNNLTSTNANEDEDTNLDLAMSALSQTYNALTAPYGMLTPGNGAPGAAPQGVLMIVSDGMIDEAYGSGGPICGPADNRVCGAVNTVATQNWCTNIKNSGIRIAFLYTTYQPLPDYDWNASAGVYTLETNGSIPAAAEACASPGLFYEVDSGGDISAALTQLFQTAVSTARLTH